MEFTLLSTDDVEEAPKFDDPSPVVLRCYLNEDLEMEFDDEIPNWLDFELSEIGIDCVMDVHDWPTWALNNGLRCDQTFSVRMWRPEYHQDYFGEWDVDYEWEMLGVASCPQSDALAFWEGWLRGDPLLHDRTHASPVMPQRVCTGPARPRLGACRAIPGMLVRLKEDVLYRWDGQRIEVDWTPCTRAGGCDRIGFPDSLLEWSCGFHVDGFGRGHTTTDNADPNPCVGGGE